MRMYLRVSCILRVAEAAAAAFFCSGCFPFSLHFFFSSAYPFFTVDTSKYPKRETRLRFIDIYLRKVLSLHYEKLAQKEAEHQRRGERAMSVGDARKGAQEAGVSSASERWHKYGKGALSSRLEDGKSTPVPTTDSKSSVSDGQEENPPATNPASGTSAAGPLPLEKKTRCELVDGKDLALHSRRTRETEEKTEINNAVVENFEKMVRVGESRL